MASLTIRNVSGLNSVPAIHEGDYQRLSADFPQHLRAVQIP